MPGLTIRLWLKKGIVSPRERSQSCWVPKALRCIIQHQRLCSYDENIRCYLPYLLSNIFLFFRGQLLSHCHVFYAEKFFNIEETIKATGIEIPCASSSGSVYEDIWRPCWHMSVPRFLTNGHSTINMPGADLNHKQTRHSSCGGPVYIDSPGQRLCHCPMDMYKLPHCGPGYSNNSEARHDNLASACTG